MAKKRKKPARKRISAALSRFLKKQNPGKWKGAKGARVKKSKDGSVRFTPVR